MCTHLLSDWNKLQRLEAVMKNPVSGRNRVLCHLLSPPLLPGRHLQSHTTPPSKQIPNTNLGSPSAA